MRLVDISLMAHRAGCFCRITVLNRPISACMKRDNVSDLESSRLFVYLVQSVHARLTPGFHSSYPFAGIMIGRINAPLVENGERTVSPPTSTADGMPSGMYEVSSSRQSPRLPAARPRDELRPGCGNSPGALGYTMPSASHVEAMTSPGGTD